MREGVASVIARVADSQVSAIIRIAVSLRPRLGAGVAVIAVLDLGLAASGLPSASFCCWRWHASR